MKRVRPLLRAGILGLPLLAGGCMGGVIPGPDTADTSCVLLCALQRELTGTPAAAPPIATPGPDRPARKSIRRSVARPHAAATPKAGTAAGAGAPRRATSRRPAAQVSVVPQAPARVLPPPSAAIAPPAPAPTAVAPPPAAEPTRSFSQSIPGSAGIMLPGWQGR